MSSSEGEVNNLSIIYGGGIAQRARVKLELVGGIESREGRHSAFWKHSEGYYCFEDKGATVFKPKTKIIFYRFEVNPDLLRTGNLHIYFDIAAVHTSKLGRT